MNFRNPDVDPPCGWHFIVTDEKGKTHRMEGNNHADLVQRTLEFCLVNGFDIPDNLDQSITDYICTKCPDGWCVDEHARPIKLTAALILRGTQAILKSYNPANLEQDEARIAARATICRECPFNVDIACPACDRAKALFAQRIRRSDLLHDGSLHNCAACGCFIGVKVQFSAAYLKANHRDNELYPSTFMSTKTGQSHACWLHAILNGADHAPA